MLLDNATVVVENIARLRDSVKNDFLAREGVKLSYLPFFAKAAIDALKQHPSLNATLDTEKGEITYHDREHVAFADGIAGLHGQLNNLGLGNALADIGQLDDALDHDRDE